MNGGSTLNFENEIVKHKNARQVRLSALIEKGNVLKYLPG